MSHSKRVYIALKNKAKQTYKHLLKYLDEYNEEANTSIDFHTFFVEVLMYSEDDYANLLKWRKKVEDRAKRHERHKFDPNKPIPHGIGDIENPEYDKYFNIFVDYNKKYLSRVDIEGKKTLTGYFKLVYGYDDEKALEEATKIQKIVFTKKRSGVNNKLIVKEVGDNELRIIGKI